MLLPGRTIGDGSTDRESLLFSNNRLLPADIEIDREIREALANSGDRNIEFFAEFFDQPRFSGQAYEQTIVTYLSEKYVTRSPEIIIVAGRVALDFLLRHRGALFPNVPVVHVSVGKAFLQSIQPLPGNVVGVPVEYDYAGTIQQALRWHPNTRRLVVVTAASGRDREFESDARAGLARLQVRPTVEFLAGLSTDAVVKRLGELGSGDVVFTPGYFRDGAGREFAPRDSAVIMAAASGAPVYGPYNTFIGTGVVGGRMPTYVEMGRQAATAVNGLLDGVPPAKLRLPASIPAQVQIDWRQARKWGIAANEIPDDAIVHFREPTFWEQHREKTILIVTVILLQAALIAALLIERRRRRQAASALEESENRMNLAAYAARLSMWIWDFGRGKVWTTTKLRVNAGLPARAPVNFDQVLETVHPADRESFDRAVRQAIAKDEELDVEYRVLQPDGEVRWIAARGRAEKGGGERVMGVSMDITVRKVAELHADEAERSLAHAARLAVVGELTAMVAHEINQPLGAILSNADAAEMLLDSADPPLGEIRQILSDIRRSDLRANEAVLRIRTLLSKRQICLQPVDLNATIVDVQRLAAADLQSRQIPVHNELAPSLPPVSGDRVHLQQLLLNLFVNAMEAMKDTPVASRLLAVSTRRDGADSIEVVVADRGHGIAPDKLSGVFESFFTTKNDGMGLGLSIARSIVRSHQGRIWAENRAGGGAAFHFTVKVAQVEAA